MTELTILFYFKAAVTVTTQNDCVIGFNWGMGSRRGASGGSASWWFSRGYVAFAWA